MVKDDLLDIPEKWVWTTLGELGSVYSGSTPSTKEQDNFGGDIPWLTPADLSGFEAKFIKQGERNLTRKGLKSCSAKLLPKGTILFSSRAPIGYVAIAANPISTNQGFKNLVLSDEVFNEYVFYYLKANKLLAESYASGTTFLELSAKRFKRIPIPLPPLNEQHRIVSKVESLLFESKTAKQSLEKIPSIVQKFRQSVLVKAFSGELTRQDPNDEPAAKLLEKIRRERRKKWDEDLIAKGKDPGKHKYKEPRSVNSEKLPKLPNGWTWTNFDTLCWEITVGHVGRMANEYVKEGIPFLRSLNVRENRFEPKKLKFISEEFHSKLQKSRLSPGDIVVVRSGNVGVSCVIPDTVREANCSDLIIARPVNGFLPEYGSFFINSRHAREQIYTMKVGIAQTHFNISSMKKLLIPLAPYTEQNRILSKITRLFSWAANIEKAREATKKRVDEIEQAILTKAFIGELVPQDPNDEPASVLLQRIKKKTKKVQMRARKKKRELRPPTTVQQTPAEPPKSIRAILEELGEATVEQVFEASGLDMNDFWDEIVIEIAAGRIEKRRKGNLIYLKVKS